MTVKIIHKNSRVEFKNSTAGQLEYGELALNYNESGPYLQCKGSDDEVVQLGGVFISATAPGNPLPGKWWLNGTTLNVYDGTQWIAIAGGGGGGGGSSDPVYNGKLTLEDEDGNTLGTFTANQATNNTITIPTSDFSGSWDDLTDKPIIGNGKITIEESNGNDIAEFTVNQAGNLIITLPAGASFSGSYDDLTDKPTIGDGSIEINGGAGITASGDNATANQVAGTTRTLTAKIGAGLDFDGDGNIIVDPNLDLGGGGGDCAEETAKRNFKVTFVGHFPKADWAEDADTVETSGPVFSYSATPRFVTDDPVSIDIARSGYGHVILHWDADQISDFVSWMQPVDGVMYWRIQMVDGKEQLQFCTIQLQGNPSSKLGEELDVVWTDDLGLYCPEQAQPHPWEDGRFSFWVHILDVHPTEGDTVRLRQPDHFDVLKAKYEEKLAELVVRAASEVNSGIPEGKGRFREQIENFEKKIARINDERLGAALGSKAYGGPSVWKHVMGKHWVRVHQDRLERGGEYVIADRGDWAGGFLMNFKADFVFGPLTNTTRCGDMSAFMAGCDFTGDLWWPGITGASDGAGWLFVQHTRAWDLTAYFESAKIQVFARDHVHIFPAAKYVGAFFQDTKSLEDFWFMFEFPMVQDMFRFWRIGGLTYVYLEGFKVNTAAAGVDLASFFEGCKDIYDCEYVCNILMHANNLQDCFAGCTSLTELSWNKAPLDLMRMGNHANREQGDSYRYGFKDMFWGTKVSDISWMYAPYCEEVDASYISDKPGFKKPQFGTVSYANDGGGGDPAEDGKTTLTNTHNTDVVLEFTANQATSQVVAMPFLPLDIRELQELS